MRGLHNKFNTLDPHPRKYAANMGSYVKEGIILDKHWEDRNMMMVPGDRELLVAYPVKKTTVNK
jgi:hypothetical protein